MVGDVKRDERAISPVVGAVLMVAIVVAIGAVSAGMLFGLSEEPEPSPDVTLSLEATDRPAQHAIVHATGDRLVGEQVELRGTTDPEALDGSELTAGASHPIYPVEETVQVVWHGDDDTSYVLWEFEVDPDETVPEPDERCPWVEEESDDGTNFKVEGKTVACDVTVDEPIEVWDGGIVIGNTVSETRGVDATHATFYGDVKVKDVFNLENGLVTGSVDSETADVKLDNGSVGGSISAVKVVDVSNGSSVGDDVVSDGLVKVLHSDVSGSVVSDDSVKLDGATIEHDVYVDPAEFDCTNSTIDGQDCDAYTPKTPEDY